MTDRVARLERIDGQERGAGAVVADDDDQRVRAHRVRNGVEQATQLRVRGLDACAVGRVRRPSALAAKTVQRSEASCPVQWHVTGVERHPSEERFGCAFEPLDRAVDRVGGHVLVLHDRAHAVVAPHEREVAAVRRRAGAVEVARRALPLVELMDCSGCSSAVPPGSASRLRCHLPMAAVW